MHYFQIIASWEDVESYLKSSESGLVQLRDKMGFMYALNEPIVYFATTSPTVIEMIRGMFKLKPIEQVDYHLLKMKAEGIQWGFLDRFDFF